LDCRARRKFSAQAVNAAEYPAKFRFSPDGTHFRFTAGSLTTSLSSLWEARLDGTELREILPGWNKPPAECCGDWTRNGRYFAFVSVCNGISDVWTLLEKASFGRSVSHLPAQLTTGPLQMSEVLPTKDGKQLLAGGSQLKGELVKFDTKTGQLVPVLGGISAGEVEFSRDGQWAAYVQCPAFYRFRISDGKLERVFDLKTYRLFPGQFSAPWTGLAPGDAPLFVRDISTSEIYAFDVDFP
jgi:WD40 repeat protein